jgi:hypothetical protein
MTNGKINWIRYHTGDYTTDVYNLDAASYFRHVEKGHESAFEFEIQGEKFRIMQSMHPEAYQAVLNYINAISGHDLTHR